MKGQMSEWLDGQRTDRLVDRWMDVGEIDEGMDEWMVGWDGWKLQKWMKG